jgi:hypothetical protein
MLVHIPEVFRAYIQLLLFKGYAETESGVVQRLAEEGLLQILIAVSRNELGDPETAIEFLENCETVSIVISDDFRGVSKIESLSKLFNISEDLSIALLVEVALRTEGYYFLRHEIPDYQNDDDYRMIVDSIPHDPKYESKEKVPEQKSIMIEDEELDIHRIH